MILNNKYALALTGLVALTASAAFADDQALIDALVRKGILSQKDAEQVESEVSEKPFVGRTPKQPAQAGTLDKGTEIRREPASALPMGRGTGSRALVCSRHSDSDAEPFASESYSHADGQP